MHMHIIIRLHVHNTIIIATVGCNGASFTSLIMLLRVSEDQWVIVHHSKTKCPVDQQWLILMNKLISINITSANGFQYTGWLIHSKLTIYASSAQQKSVRMWFWFKIPSRIPEECFLPCFSHQGHNSRSIGIYYDACTNQRTSFRSITWLLKFPISYRYSK